MGTINVLMFVVSLGTRRFDHALDFLKIHDNLKTQSTKMLKTQASPLTYLETTAVPAFSTNTTPA